MTQPPSTTAQATKPAIAVATPIPHKTAANASQAFWEQQQQENLRGLVQGLIVCVLLPTLLAALYLFFIAAPQFQSETHISLRAPNQSTTPSAFGSFITGLSGSSQSTQDVRAIAAYLHSHEAVSRLSKKIDLRAILSHPDADILSRLPADATVETLLKKFIAHVDVVFNMDTSAIAIYTRAYTADDALALAQAILELSEEAVNGYNSRAEEDGLRLAREELSSAADHVTATSQNLSEFRTASREIDPTSKSGSILESIATLEEERNTLQVRQRELSAYAAANNPELRALERRISALQKQVEMEQERLTGTGNTYTQKLSDYEALKLEQQLAQQAYASALVSLENARLDAQRQKTYVVPIIQPHKPDEAEFPRQMRGITMTLLASLLIFGIGRLILSGVRDHIMH